MITATIKLHGRPKKRTEIIQTIKELINQLSKDTKCREVKIYQEIDDIDTFFLVEDWSTGEDLDEYLSSRLFKILLGVRPILEYPLEIKMFNEIKKSQLRNDFSVKDSQDPPTGTYP
jgi:quinol monooxygenase YgiN